MSANYNITVNKYSDFSRTFAIKSDDVIQNITGYSFSGKLKENFNAPTGVDFLVVILDQAQGLFKIYLTDAITANMSPGVWVYDVVMTDPLGDKTRLLEGNAFIRQGVTA